MTQSETTKRRGNTELSALMIKLKHKGILPQLPDKKDNGFTTLNIFGNTVFSYGSYRFRYHYEAVRG